MSNNFLQKKKMKQQQQTCTIIIIEIAKSICNEILAKIEYEIKEKLLFKGNKLI